MRLRGTVLPQPDLGDENGSGNGKGYGGKEKGEGEWQL